MRTRLIFWLIIFFLGALAGDRYGLPGILTGLTDRGFEALEGMIPGGQAANEEDGAEDDAQALSPASAPPSPASAELGNAENAGLRINEAGLQIIKESEGLRLEAYSLGGKWFIGYGHSRTARAGMTISEAKADQLLREDVRAFEDAVRKMVLVPVNRNQFSAMVSLAYNLGTGGFSRSSVLEKINAGKYQSAADAFLSYNKGKINGARQVIPHLSERREKERALFLS